MFSWFIRFFTPPANKDHEKNTMTATLTIILLILLAASFFLIVDDWLTMNRQNLIPLLLLGVATTVSLWLTRRGHLTLPRFLVPLLGLMIVTDVILVNNLGIHDIGMMVYPAVIILAAMLLGKEAPFVFALLSLGAVAFIVHAEVTGLMNSRFSVLTDYSDLISIAIILALTAALTQILMNNLMESVEQARHHEVALLEAHNQLQAYTQQLEQQEQALRQSEAQYRLMADHSTDMISRHTSEGVYLYASPACRHLLGYEPEDLVGHSAYEFIHPDDRAAVHHSHTIILKQSATPSTVYRIRCKNGTYTWIETTSTMVCDSQTGEISEIIATSRDISGRKQAEEALRLSEERYRMLAENLPGSAIILFDHELRFILVDGPEIERTGYSKAAMEGKLLADALPAEFVQRVEPNMRAVLAGHSFCAELPFGETIYFYQYLPIKNNTDDMVYGLILAQNITERKQAEVELRRAKDAAETAHEILREREAYLQAILNNMPFQVWLKDLEGRFLMVNEPFVRSVELPNVQSVTGKTDFDVTHKELAAKYRTDDQEVIRSKTQMTIEELMRDRGQIKWFETYKTPILDEDGQVLGTTGFARDITEHKRAKEERESLIKELEAKNAELERFTYTVSHDLKSPLVTIKGFLGWLEKDVAAGNTERMQHDFQQIRDAATKMQNLLDDLLELSRIGRLMNPPQTVAITELVHEAMQLVAGQIEARGVQVNLAPNLPLVSGDRPRLVEVFQNLIDNAVKFMGSQPSPRIDIGVRDQAGKMVFFVQDNGSGIAARYHQRIFDLFERLEQNTEGTGVGLALVKRIVEVHGGRIRVESDGPGQGSTVCFTLPIVY